MPKTFQIQFSGQTLNCPSGANLRRVLLDAKLPLYNGISKQIHCRGLGTCGTCAVEITGSVSDVTPVEQWRLQFPPHAKGNDLRLACQCKVLGDLKIKKHAGMWGHQKT